MHDLRFTRRLLTGLALAVGGLVLALLVIVRARADASWHRMTATAERVRLQLSAETSIRTPLHGKAISENAWAHHRQALRITRAMHDEIRAARIAATRRDPADVAIELEGLRRRWRPALESLRRATLSTDIAEDRHQTLDQHAHRANVDDHDLLTSRDLVSAVAFEAYARTLAGRDVEAVELVLDALSLATDLIYKGTLVRQMIGVALIEIAVQDLEAMRARWSAPAIELLAHGLRNTDARLHERIDLRPDLVATIDYLREERQPVNQPSATLRFGFSRRWMTARAVLRLAQSYDQMANFEPGSWLQRSRDYAQSMQQLAESDNPAANQIGPNVRCAEEALRRAISAIRHLRVVVDGERGLSLELVDPLTGQPIR